MILIIFIFKIQIHKDLQERYIIAYKVLVSFENVVFALHWDETLE